MPIEGYCRARDPSLHEHVWLIKVSGCAPTISMQALTHSPPNVCEQGGAIYYSGGQINFINPLSFTSNSATSVRSNYTCMVAC